jgi:hypothetical protein
MKTLKLATLGILFLTASLAGACSGSRTDNRATAAYAVTALPGSSASALRVQERSSGLLVELPALAQEGVFFEVVLPDGTDLVGMRWQNAAGAEAVTELLAMCQLSDGILTAGAVPLAGHVGENFALLLEATVDPQFRMASAELDEIREEAVPGLSADYSPIGGDVLLSWPAWATGDYDLSGMVGIQDITPLGRNFGAESGSSGQPWPLSDPLHWIDGNADGFINAGDLSLIGQNFNSELLGFRVYADGLPLPGMDEFKLNLLHGESQGLGLPRRHFLHLQNVSNPQSLELRAVLRRLGSTSGGSNPDLEVHLSIDGVEIIDNEQGLKAGTRVIRPIEDIAGQRDIIAQPEKEDGNLASFRGIPRDRDFLLNITYEPANYPGGDNSNLPPGTQGAEGLVNTSVPFRLPELYGRAVISVDIHYVPQQDGSYFVELNSSIDYGNGVEQYSALLDYAGGLLRRDANRDGSFNGELAFSDIDRDCVSDNFSSELFGTSNYPAAGQVQGVFDGPLESIDYINSVLTMAEGSQQLWSDGILRNERSVHFSENAVFAGFSDIHALLPGDFVHIELIRLEDPLGGLPGQTWAEFIHALDSEFEQYWISAVQLQSSQLVEISAGRLDMLPDERFEQFFVQIRDELDNELQELPMPGTVHVPLWPGHLYTITLLGLESGSGQPVLLGDVQILIDPDLFWDDFGGPDGNPAGGPIGSPGN